MVNPRLDRGKELLVLDKAGSDTVRLHIVML